MTELPDSPTIEAPEEEKAAVTLPGTVEKIIKAPHPAMPEQAQIAVEGAEELYREIRIDNTLIDKNGDKVKLKVGTEVEVTVEAPVAATTPHSEENKES